MITSINEFRKIFENQYSHEDIIQHITNISDRPGTDVPDYYFELLRKAKPNFERKELNIQDILQMDPSVAEYVNSGEDRYEDEDEYPDRDELYFPIVIWNNEVIDGYNRLSTLYKQGEKTVTAYVSINATNESLVSEEEAKNIIASFTHYKSGGNYYPRTQWAEWFLSQSRSSKKYVVREIQNNPNLHNALLSSFYHLYCEEVDNSMTYEQFLQTDILVYRGLTLGDQKNSWDEGFVAYTITPERAKNHSHSRNIENVISIHVKPKDTYGAVQFVGAEIEVMVPIPLSDKTLEEELTVLLNNNGRLMDDETHADHISDLMYDKKFEEAIQYIKSIIKK